MNALEYIFKNPVNVNIIDKYIKKNSNSESDYIQLVYEVIGIYITTKCSVSDLLNYIYTNKIGWNNPFWDEYRKKRDEEELFLTIPLDVEDGVLECGKCGSRRTISFQKQIRSADEGATTFAQCVNCKNKWTHNN